ncbi:hypothetical protein FQR65_LT11696 [Abscondita terminalis]|nr:hypothetical protein FQR65_LT11696 [Abscondita terminalis]
MNEKSWNERNVSARMYEDYPIFKRAMKICDSCRKQFPPLTKSVEVVDDEPSVEAVAGASIQQSEEEYFDSELAISSTNSTLKLFGETPIKRKKIHSVN